MADNDYDKGEITDRERLAAQHQKELSQFSADSVRNQLEWQLQNYDMADRQNRRLADVQLKQNSRMSAANRFTANRDLQRATSSLLSGMGNAMNGVGTYNLATMLRDRTDKDNNTYWEELQKNQNSVENAYDEAVNQNQLARNDAANDAEFSLRGIEADLAANLNNINPNLYENPGAPPYHNILDSSDTYKNNMVKANRASLAGYLMPEDSRRTAQNIQGANRLAGGDYYSQLMNSYRR